MGDDRELAASGSRRPGRVAGGLVLLVAAAAVFAFPRAHGQGKGDAAGGRTVPVVATAARKGSMPIYLTGLGQATAFNTVTVRSRVDGELVEVAYEEGQKVEQGQLLAVIDTRPYEVQLAIAQAQRDRDQALLTNARIDLKRYKDAKEAVPEQQVATQQALIDQYVATIENDDAQIKSANLNLTYCRITSPITGRIGLRLVDRGNIVHASDTGGIAVVTQVQPIAVVFSLAEDVLPKVTSLPNRGAGLIVLAYDRELKKSIATGKLLTIDNQIDPSTGTVRFKASFPNDGDELFPNQFVNARLLISTRTDSVIVPTAAVQRGTQSTIVYVVKADSTVETKKVLVGPSEGDDSLIEQGLSPGEVVVIDGLDKLQSGTKVNVKRADEKEKSGA
jgi:multidrug efflux system membrane fusion protein